MNKAMNDLLRSKAGRIPEAQEQPAHSGPGSADGGAGNGSRPRLTFADMMNAAIKDKSNRNRTFTIGE